MVLSVFIDNEIKSLFMKSDYKSNDIVNSHSYTVNVIRKSEFKKIYSTFITPVKNILRPLYF